MIRYETPHPHVSIIVTGHFNQGSGYSAWRPKGTQDWLLIYTINHRGRFGYGAGELFTEPGDWVLLRPGTLHDYGVESTVRKWELLWTHFHPRTHWLPLLRWPTVHKGLMRLRIANATSQTAAVDRFLAAHRLATGALRNREQFAMNALEEVLLWCDQANTALPSQVDARIREAMDYLIQNLYQKLTLPDAAERAGLSVSRFGHLFKAETGQTPQQFLESQRVERAAQLLQRTTFSIKQIASAVGFENPLYFSLRFKGRMKVSPKAYREKFRAEG